MLEALNCLASTSRPTAPVVHLMQEEDSLQRFEFLRALAPTMTAAEFIRRVASAFLLWPAQLLEAELNQDALASSVQHTLFEGNPDGWKAYATHIQKKVAWFGIGLPAMKVHARAEPARDAAKDATPVEELVAPTLPATPDAPIGKRGWPWPEPGSRS
jgi:hypothetical protein